MVHHVRGCQSGVLESEGEGFGVGEGECREGGVEGLGVVCGGGVCGDGV